MKTLMQTLMMRPAAYLLSNHSTHLLTQTLTAHTITIRWPTDYQLTHTLDFNPNKVHTYSTNHSNPLPFINGYFDEIEPQTHISPPFTTGFLPALEYNANYCPLPFHSSFPENYLEPVRF